MWLVYALLSISWVLICKTPTLQGPQSFYLLGVIVQSLVEPNFCVHIYFLCICLYYIIVRPLLALIIFGPILRIAVFIQIISQMHLSSFTSIIISPCSSVSVNHSSNLG